MGTERGAVTIVAVTGALILCLVALGAADLGSMLLARARAQTAADAAALAAVTEQAPAFSDGRTPEDAARAEAERNNADLVRCECEEGASDATVEVVVSPRLLFVAEWFGRPAHATARASLDPDVLS